MAVLRGVVHSGSGFDTKLVEREQEVFAEALGMRLYPGSLNVHLDKPIAFSKYRRVECRGGERMCVDALLNGRRVVISHRFPLRPPARRRLLVFAEERLRDALQLTDGSVVLVELDDDAVADVPLIDSLALARRECTQWMQDAYRGAKWRMFQALKRQHRI